ncbi:MAG: hypothetical protein ACKO2G_08055 [Verrucomicrobiales bacterium]
MSLLVVLTIALLGLASNSLRMQAVGVSQATAQANARLAMQLALASLQRNAGSDQRITAAADLMGENNNSQWIGVWSAMLDDNPAKPMVAGHGQTRRDVPSYLDLRSSDPALANGEWRKRQFRGWLVSGDSPQPSPTAASTTAIELVGPGTVGNSATAKERVSAPYVQVRGDTRRSGGYAWWVGDESLKGRVDLSSPDQARPPSLQSPANGGLRRLAAAPVPGARDVVVADGSKPFGALSGLDAATRERMVNLATMGMALNQPGVQTGFHHVTTHSAGLLVGVITGSLKKDLTAFIERTNGAPAVPGMTGTGLAANTPILPSPSYRRSGPNFTQLKNWYDLRSMVQGSFADTRVENPPFVPTRSGLTSQTHYNLSSPLPDVTRYAQPLQPVLTDFRLAFDFSHDPNPARANGRGIRVHLYPRVTLWNPYNVTLRGQTYYVGTPLPPTYGLQIGGQALVNVNGSTSEMFPGVAPRDTNRHLIYFTLASIDLGPGEAVVFSPSVVDSAGERLAGNSVRYVPENIGANVLSAVIPSGTNNFHLVSNFGVADGVNLASRPNYHFAGGVNQGFDNGPTLMLKRLRGGDSNVTLATLNSSSAETLQLMHCGGNGSRVSWYWHLFGDATLAVNGGTGFESYTNNPNRFPPRLWAVQTRMRWFDESDEEASIGITHNGAQRPFWYNNPLIANFNVRAPLAFRDPMHFYFGWSTAPGTFINPWSTPRLNDTRMSLPFRNGKAYGSPFSAPNEIPGPFAMFEVPRPEMPIFSLASFQHAQLGYQTWQPTYIVGHSTAEPRSDRNSTTNSVFRTAGEAVWGSEFSRSNERPGVWPGLVQDLQTEMLVHDVTFAVNQQIWDRFFLSTIPYNNGSVSWNPEAEALPNSNLRPLSSRLDPADRARLTGDNSFDHAAAFLANYGAFNVNSTSVEAWRAMLSSLNDLPRPTLEGEAIPDTFSRLLVPLSAKQPQSRRAAGTWSGARRLTATEIDALSRSMVEIVRERGPFLGMADFVNRRLGPAGSNDMRDPTICGPLQAAIERAGINAMLQNPSDKDLTSYEVGTANADQPGSLAGIDRHGSITPDWRAYYPFKNYGAPGYLTQADVLQTLGHRLTTRGDTFVIRTYGDAKDPSGRVTSRAWCEAVVQRIPDYIDAQPIGAAAGTGGNNALEPAAIRGTSDFNQSTNTRLLDVNRRYGRRFVIQSFRWLSPSEI